MRVSFLFLAFFVSLSATGALLAQETLKVRNAFESGFESHEDFNTIFNFVSSRENENRWRQVPWVPSLWEGIEIAAQKKKPMFIWAMNGDPLSCV